MSLARTERAALADLFAEVGDDQPTLCEGWQTRDLLVHLIVRERRFDAVAGNYLPPLRDWGRRVARSYKRRPWTELIDEYREGPPAWSPLRIGRIDELTNNGEMFIHHEDVRRGRPGWSPRTFDAATTAVLADLLDSRLSKLALRHASVGVRAELPGGRTVTLKDGDPAVTLVGDPGEHVLWISGRDAVELEFRGDPDAVAQLRATRRGV